MKKLVMDQKAVYGSFFVLLFLGLFLGWALSKNFGGAAEGPVIQADLPIRVDPTVELFSVLYRLAGINQYTERELPGYVEEVEEYFGAYQDHPAIQVVKDLNESHAINGNAPMDLAVRLSVPPGLELRTPMAEALGDMDSRWDEAIVPVLLEAARTFAVDTDFMAFFQAHEAFYDSAVQSLAATLSETDMLPWFKQFFGAEPESYVVILGLLNGSCNYGSRVTHPDSAMEFTSMLGAIDPDRNGIPRYAQDRFVPTIVHEFSHSYINPLVDRHAEALRPSGEVIFSHLGEAMEYWGYNHWYVMYYEYLVRASTVRYLEVNDGARAVDRMVERDEEGGFVGVGELAGILADYEDHRDQYPDLDAFMPRVVEFFDLFAKAMGGEGD